MLQSRVLISSMYISLSFFFFFLPKLLVFVLYAMKFYDYCRKKTKDKKFAHKSFLPTTGYALGQMSRFDAFVTLVAIVAVASAAVATDAVSCVAS